MKKNLLKQLVVMIMAVAMIATLTACEDGGDSSKSAKSDLDDLLADVFEESADYQEDYGFPEDEGPWADDFEYSEYEPTESEDGFYYRKIEGGGVEIVEYRDIDTVVSLTIPDELDGEPVIAIEYLDDGHNMDLNMTEIYLPESCTIIGSSAFNCMENLENVHLSSKTEYIGPYAFAECKSLKTIELPDTITYIGPRAFEKSGLEEVVIPKGLTLLEEEVFNSTNLKSVVIPSNIKGIKSEAFKWCDYLTSVKIEEGLEQLGWAVFSQSADPYSGNMTVRLPKSLEIWDVMYDDLSWGGLIYEVYEGSYAESIFTEEKLGSNYGTAYHEVVTGDDTEDSTGDDITPTGDAIKWVDPEIEAEVRDILEKPDGEIQLSELTEITALSCSGATTLDDLVHFTNLEELSISGEEITDFTPISTLTTLNDLAISNTGITDITSISELTNLTVLDLSYSKVTDISSLESLTDLDTLNIRDTDISDISPLSELDYLMMLYMHNTKVTDLTPLADCINIFQLSLGGNEITDLTPLSNFMHLSSLELYETSVVDISPLANMSISRLDLSGTDVEDLTPLATVIDLADLILLDTKVTDISPLAGLESLEYLDLTGTNVEDWSHVDHVENLTGKP